MGYYGYGYKKPISVRIDVGVLEQTKKKLEEENVGVSTWCKKTLTDVIEDGLKYYLEKPIKKK